MNLDKHASFLSFKGTDNIGKIKTTECIKASLMPCLISLANCSVQNIRMKTTFFILQQLEHCSFLQKLLPFLNSSVAQFYVSLYLLKYHRFFLVHKKFHTNKEANFIQALQYQVVVGVTVFCIKFIRFPMGYVFFIYFKINGGVSR